MILIEKGYPVSGLSPRRDLVQQTRIAMTPLREKLISAVKLIHCEGLHRSCSVDLQAA
jgi:hypothetical protein